jgi:Zn-dependent peptidase ImmA (M78 family)
MQPSRLRTIKSKAKELLHSAKISAAPVDVESVARHLGAVISKTPAEDEISGFLLRNADGSALIGVNALHHPNRQRFTVAHEIGHLELHKHDQVHVDRSVIRLRSTASSKGEDAEEIEANRFAAELLMPEGFLIKDFLDLGLTDLNDEKQMLQLARRYQVSVQAMTNRLASIGFISGSVLA